jgi:hypothetical protein
MGNGAVTAAMRALERSIEIFRHKTNASLPCAFLDATKRSRLERKPPPGSLGDDAARLAAGHAMIQILAELLDQLEVDPGRRFFLSTFCWDEGRVDPLKPVDEERLFKRLKHKVFKTSQALDLNGIGVVETAPFRKSKLHNEMFFAHIHVLHWTSDKSFKPNKAAQELMDGRSFPNSLGIPSVTIRSRKKARNLFRGGREARDHLFSDRHLDQTPKSLAWLGYYLFQAPSYVKHAYRKKKWAKAKLRTSQKNYPLQLASALQSFLCLIPIPDAVFGIGEGRRIRVEWKRRYRRDVGAHFSVEVERSANPAAKFAWKPCAMRWSFHSVPLPAGAARRCWFTPQSR